MKRGVLVALLAGCGAESRPAEPFAMDRCELATLRLVTFGDAAACAAGVPAEGTDLPAPVDDVTWATDGGAPPVLRVPESGPVTVVAFCADADGVVRQWGCDDDSDGDLDVHLLEACTTSEGACDPDRRGGHAWTGSGGPSCVRDCACAEPDNPPGTDWTEEIVVADGEWDHGMVRDLSGDFHVAAYRAGTGMHVLSRTAGEWTDELVDPDGADYGTSMALDDAGAMHVAYFDFSGLRHATNASGDWTIEPVDATSGYGGIWSRTSIVTMGDEVHIGYASFSVDVAGVRYAVRRDGTWSWEDVEMPAGGVACPQLALGPDGRPHLTYQGADGVLSHVTKDGADWTRQSIDTVSCSSDILVDANGIVHIMFMAGLGVGSGLRYATNASGVWSEEWVDDTPNAGFGSVMWMGPGCTLHVAHTTFGPGTLRLATGRAGAWRTEQIRDSLVWPPTLAFDDTGALFTTFGNDADGFGLSFATRPGGDGIDQNCDGIDGLDADADGHASTETFGDDCDDGDPAVHPGAPDEGQDGVDQDCDCRDGPAS